MRKITRNPALTASEQPSGAIGYRKPDETSTSRSMAHQQYFLPNQPQYAGAHQRSPYQAAATPHRTRQWQLQRPANIAMLGTHGAQSPPPQYYYTPAPSIQSLSPQQSRGPQHLPLQSPRQYQYPQRALHASHTEQLAELPDSYPQPSYHAAGRRHPASNLSSSQQPPAPSLSLSLQSRVLMNQLARHHAPLIRHRSRKSGRKHRRPNMCHEQPQKSRSTTKQRVDTVVVPSASSSYHTNAKKNSGSESATTAALDNRKASASASSQPSSASNATKERLPSHRDDLVALGHPLIALPHYLSPQTQDMCAHLERMGKNTRILAPGVRPLPADVPMSGIDASHLLSKNFIPMPWGERPSGQASQGSSGLEKADGKSQKQAMQSYQPQKKRYHCIVRLCRRYSIWIRAIAICLAGASSILFLTSYYALDADPKVHTYGITLAPILYAAATALLAFLISGLAVPTLIWRTPTQIYRALAMADGVVMTCWLVAGIIILSPTDDPVAPRPFVCNPSYNHISTCKRLTAGSILTFLSAVVHVALLGSSLLHIRRRRLAELIDKC